MGQKRKGIKTANQKTTGQTQGEKIISDEVRLRNAEWILARMKSNQLPIYTMDLETDPFARNKVPKPFCGGLYDGLTFLSFWNDRNKTCLEMLKDYFEAGVLEPGIVYMHNGGRFDFFYVLEWFEGKSMIIGSRIVRAFMPIGQSKKRLEKTHRFEFRDSYAIMPFPLAEYQKDKIDINKLHRDRRDENREEIIEYLKGDCVYLWDLCMQFQQEFGDYKTIASASFAQLGEFHKYDTLPVRQDQEIRASYYFGGRVQCFQKGVIEKPVTIYDVNSMYPFVMDTYFHPTSWIGLEDDKVHGWNPDGTFNNEKLKTFFLTVEGEAMTPAPFAARKHDGSVTFESGFGIYHTTIHEYLVALELGLFKTRRIIKSYSFPGYSRFHLFVSHFYKAREKTKADMRDHKKVCPGCAQEPPEMCTFGSDITAHNLFYKYVLNSAYGKFGLNPENYFNWEITKTARAPKGNFWELDTIVQEGKYYVWKQPNQLPWNVKNIGTAASITGAARSVLLRAIAQSASVVYCDTDSIICTDFSGGEIDEKRLGAWKAEGAGVLAAIAGKKMYAVYNSEGTCIKHACKGVDLEPEQILQLAKGQSILTYRDAPTFKRDGSATFISRTVRMT